MSEFIALQRFAPKEYQGESKCIWCKQQAPRNRAHIISRKLTLTSHETAVLKYSVCQTCNAKCSQIERWVLRNSPLGWVRLYFYLGSNKGSDSSTIPAYFYDEDQREWLIYTLEGWKSSKTIDSQLILTNEGQLRLIAEHLPDTQLETIRNSIGTATYAVDIRPTLPENFSPRALVDSGRVIVIARTQTELDTYVDTVGNSRPEEELRHRVQPKSTTGSRQHFKWSNENWLKFCAKIAYETLCLFEGPDRCLKPEFERVRFYVLAGASDHHREVVFDEHGPVSHQDGPIPLHIDLTQGQDCPTNFSAIYPRVAPGMHSVVLYEMDGWVCSSVSIAGFPAASMVLGGPDAHLHDLYMLVYDDEMDEFDAVCLAYDPSQPVIALHLEGHMNKAIVRTYKLKCERL